MKLLFCNQDLSVGGSSTVIFNIISKWHCESDQLFLVLFYSKFDSKYSSLKNVKNLKIIKLNRRNTFDFEFLKNLKSIIDRISPDVISSHLSCTFYLHLIGATKKYLTYHTVHSEPSKDLNLLYRFVLRKDIKKRNIKFIGCCEYISKKTAKLYGVDCSTINNGIDMNNFKNFHDCRNDFKTVRFLFIGRFDKVKNVPLLIKSFDFVNSKNAKLNLIGFGPDLHRIEKAILKSKNRNNICILGKKDDVDFELRNNDVLCLVSKREGLPIVVLEGIKNHNAFLVTDVGAIGDFIFNSCNGFIVEPNPIDIAKKIDYFCLNQEKLKEFKLYNDKLIKNIDAVYMALSYEKLFKKV